MSARTRAGTEESQEDAHTHTLPWTRRARQFAADRPMQLDIIGSIIADANSRLNHLNADGDRLIDYQCPFLPVVSLRRLSELALANHASCTQNSGKRFGLPGMGQEA